MLVNTPLELCEQRDPKRLDKKARAGELPNFAGIDSVYEAPEAAEVEIDTSSRSAEDLAEEIIIKLLGTDGWM